MVGFTSRPVIEITMTSKSLETVFSLDTSSIKFGPGVTRDVGYEIKRLGGSRVMIVTDANMAALAPIQATIESLEAENLDYALFDSVQIEPTDSSFKQAIDFAVDGHFDSFAAVGGGSAIDTAKAANLYSTYPADLLAYVNAPVGEGLAPPGPLLPLVAIPTTAGTGSETTGTAIFDLVEMHAKTGIAHRALRPSVALVDPENTRTLPSMVAACSGFDVLCHGLESYTALPFHRRIAPNGPGARPAYQGANPISDIWAIEAIEMVANNITRAVQDPTDDEARSRMLLAASFAGVGFGNAGVHVPHGMSYPVSGMVCDYVPEGYPSGRPMVPHGMSVVLNAPAVFRFTGPSNPERHLKAAKLLGADVSAVNLEDAGSLLADTIVGLIRQLGLPNGLRGVGYTPDDVEALVGGAIPQQRVLGLSPRVAGEEELRRLFLDSMTLW